MENNLLRITYKNGNGHLTLNLDAALPCSAADMKRICSFLDLTARPWEDAKTVYDHIAGRVAALKARRGECDPDRDKSSIADINAEMKKHLSNAAALVKRYGLPEMADDDAQTALHTATVYALQGVNGKPAAVEKRGWTFEKGGYTFSVYKDGEGRAADYIIMLYGLQVAAAKTKKTVTSEITPHVLDALKKGDKKLSDAEKYYKKLMAAAGFAEPEKEPAKVQTEKQEPEKVQEGAPIGMEKEPEKVQEPEKKEDAPAKVQAKKERGEIILNAFREGSMYDVTYTKDTVTISGKEESKTFPCEYNITESGAVLIFAVIGTKEDGRKEKQRVKIEPGTAYYTAALDAAKKAGAAVPTQKKTGSPAKVQAEKKEDAPEKVQAKKQEPEKVQAKKQDDAAQVQAARDPKQARGPVPEKSFVGQTIQGNGWKIVFDGETARTRVIFAGRPTDAARAALDAAGFFYSPKMGSWNKKLTFKAHRAAGRLAGELEKIYAA